MGIKLRSADAAQEAAAVDVVKLARGLGFQLDRISDEGDNVTWRFLAKMGTADAVETMGLDAKQWGFASEQEAARGALLTLATALDSLVDGPGFAS